MEFASSLKVLGWFVQILSDKSLTATLHHSRVIADKPDLYEALQSLLDELDSVQAMLSLAQNFRSQNKLLELLKNLMDAAYDADDLLSEVDYYRLEKQVNDSEDEDLLRKVDYHFEQQENDSEDEGSAVEELDFGFNLPVSDSEDKERPRKVDDHLKEQVNDSGVEEVDYRLQKASISSTPPSFHDNNKATILLRIHQIVSRLEDLVTCLSDALSVLELEDDLCANPNVFPAASYPLTASSLPSNQTMFLPSLYHDNRLDVLDGDEFLAMFNKCAFGGEDPSDHLELVEIAKQIAGKLNGSSIAAATVGGLLRDNLDEQHWRSVLCSDIWQQQRGPDDIIPILRFSYHHLPAHLQQCFAYCGIFPKKTTFEKEKLVGMWISQGYIHTKSAGNISPEEIGREYFDHLVSKSFIQCCPSIIDRFVLLESLHDFAESVSEDEFLRINSNGTIKFTSRVGHIYADVDYLGLLKSCNLRNLRTLIIDGCISYRDINVLKEVLNGLKSIRVLCVHTRDYSDSIGHLIHLRYLTIIIRDRYMLPDYQWRPYHLQWLDLKTDYKGRNCSFLPSAMNCLVSLRHLKISAKRMYGIWNPVYFLTVERRTRRVRSINNVCRIGKLTHLQELESFKVGRIEGQKLGELMRLDELRGTLRLRSIENVSTKEEALEANLNKKIGIRELELSCSGSHMSAQMAEEVFEGLHPPPYIKKLTLYGYNGAKSPSWMVTENHCLSYLHSLRLCACSSWKVLPPFGELPLLRHLEIEGAHSVQEIGSSFYGSVVSKAFPCLDTLKFTNMRGLALWSGIEIRNMLQPAVSLEGKDTCSFFPHLRELNVTDCPKLKQVPIQYIATVEVLKTNSLIMLSKIEHLTSLRELFIQSSTELVSVPLLPRTLECLHISCLEMLTGFSTKQKWNLSDLTSLQYMHISECPLLSSLPAMPASLQKLSIERCPKLRRKYKRRGYDWHHIHVPTIVWD